MTRGRSVPEQKEVKPKTAKLGPRFNRSDRRQIRSERLHGVPGPAGKAYPKYTKR
jgi:hypothetical protein